MSLLFLLGGCALDPKLIGQLATDGDDTSTGALDTDPATTGWSTDDGTTDDTGTLPDAGGCVGEACTATSCAVVPHLIHGIEWNPQRHEPVSVALMDDVFEGGALMVVAGDPLDFARPGWYEANPFPERTPDFVVGASGVAATVTNDDERAGFVVQDRGTGLVTVSAESDVHGDDAESYEYADIALSHDDRVFVTGVHHHEPALAEGQIFISEHIGEDSFVDSLGLGTGWSALAVRFAGTLGTHTYVEVRATNGLEERLELRDIDDSPTTIEMPTSYYGLVPDGDRWLALDFTDDISRLTSLGADFTPAAVLVEEDFEMMPRIIPAGDTVFLLELQQFGLMLHGYDRAGASLHTTSFDAQLVLPPDANGISVFDTLVADDTVFIAGRVLAAGGAHSSFVCRTPVGGVTESP